MKDTLTDEALDRLVKYTSSNDETGKHIADAIDEAILDKIYAEAKANSPLPLTSRYLPMPYADFVALSRLTPPESVPQFKAAVVSATALFKFKQNSSYFPEYCRTSLQGGV